MNTVSLIGKDMACLVMYLPYTSRYINKLLTLFLPTTFLRRAAIFNIVSSVAPVINRNKPLHVFLDNMKATSGPHYYIEGESIHIK